MMNRLSLRGAEYSRLECSATWQSSCLIWIASLALAMTINTSALATTEYKTEFSFENSNFFFNRDANEVNDNETVEADFNLIYDNEHFFKLNLDPRLKIDFLDSNRNRYLPNEAFFSLYSPSVRISSGFQLVSWGVSNSYNPTDVVNRKDLGDNYYTPDKLGEVMIRGEFSRGEWGPFRDFSLQAIFLPLFLKTPLPDSGSRFSLDGFAGPLPYTLDNNQDLPGTLAGMGAAAVISATLSGVDFSLHYYHGRERQPGYQLTLDPTGSLRLTPFYYGIDMAGINVEIPLSDFVFHLESAYKNTAGNTPRQHVIIFEDNETIPKNYFQFVPGVDYKIRHSGPQEIFVSLEYLGEPDWSSDLRNFRAFQSDLFMGGRFLFNNRLDSRIEAGVIKDLSNEEAIFLAEANTKIYKEIRLGLKGLFVIRGGSTSPLSYFDNNSYIAAKLSWAFGNRIASKTNPGP